MSGFPTGDLHPIYIVPMLGTHKAALANPLPDPSRILRVATNLNLSRRGAPGSGCQASTFAKNMNFNDILTRFPPIKTHPLFDAAWDDSTERLQSLLDGGADLYEESYGMTALYGAIENDSLQAFQFLLDYGVDPNRIIGSHLPLNIAIDKEITGSTTGGWTHGLIDDDDLRPNPIFSQSLLLYGANPELKDPWGSPIDYAKERHHYSFLELVSRRTEENLREQE